MRFFLITILLALPALADGPPALADTSNDAAVRRAQLEVSRVQDLVATGVLPRIRLEQAQNALSDAKDDSAVRSALSKQDITVEEADQLVARTGARLERRRKVADEKRKLVADGIIARSESDDAETAVQSATRDHDWAESRAKFAREIAELAKTEQELMRQLASSSATLSAHGISVEHFVGSNRFDMTQLASIDKAFTTRFSHALPVSAMGETNVHRALGFDHRNRVDVALQPDQPEGRWLRQYLTAHNIPYFAFRTAIPGKATGAHIHIGPPSDHYIASGHIPSQKRTL